MKELLSIFLVFFKIGIVNFGGGYAMLPLLSKELVDKRGWTTDQELADYFAIGQCTPGAIAVNVATFIGQKRKGLVGGIVATLGLVAPAFIIIFIIATLLTNFASNEYVQHALAGIRIAVFALVLFAIFKLAKKTLIDIWTIALAIVVGILAITVDVVPLFVYVIVAGFYGFFVNYFKNKKVYKVKAQVTEENTETETTNEEVVEESAEAEPVEEAEAIVEETDTKEEVIVKEKNDTLKNVLIFILGLFTGMLLGVIGIPLTLIYKNKKFKSGLYSTIILWFIIMISLIVLLTHDNNPIMFRLYGEFFRVGISAFGGGLATIPFLKELGQTTGWFSQVDLANMIAVSESTPGAMGINMSTYVGYTVLQNEFGNYFISFLGSIISTLGLVSPSIIVIFIVSLFLSKFKDNKYVNWVFYGLRAASIGLIIAALYSIIEISLFNVYVDAAGKSLSAFKVAFENRGDGNFFNQVANFFNGVFNWKHLAIGMGFVIGVFKFKKHPIIYIVIAAVIGILLGL